MKRFSHGLCAALMLIVAALAVVPQAFAASQGTNRSALAVSPAILEQVAHPGNTKRFTITVTNVTQVPLPIHASVKSLIPEHSDESTERSHRFDASAWFHITQPDFILQPEQRRNIEVTIKPPQDAEAGGHYATIYFQPLIPEQATSASTAYLTSKVGVLAFLIVPGDIEQKLQINGAPAVDHSRQFGPIDIKIKLHNKGNVHVLPTGKIHIYNWRGHEVATPPIKPSVILPGETRPYQVEWQPSWPFGHFYATAEVTYGPKQAALTSRSTSFWLLPWLPITLGLLVVVLVVWFVRKTHRRWRRAWAALRDR